MSVSVSFGMGSVVSSGTVVSATVVFSVGSVCILDKVSDGFTAEHALIRSASSRMMIFFMAFASLRVYGTLIPVSPLKEQKQITERIQEANEQIEHLNESTIQIGRLINKAKSKILDLAIRGQLVPQNPTDEPASVLLDRIRAEKEELIKQGKIKRDKKESVIFKGEDNSYYLSTGGQVESIEEWNLDMIPESWTLCSLGAVCDYGNCNNVEIGAINDTDWILDLEDIEKDSGRVLKKVMKKDRNANSTKHKFHKGQVLYSKLRPYLNKVVLADDDGYCTSEILPLKFHTEVSFIPMPLIQEGFANAHSSKNKTWAQVKSGFTHFRENDVGVAKITPCFENRKSVVFHNLKNGIGAGTTELHILRPVNGVVLPEYILAILKTGSFIAGGVQTFSSAVGQQRISKDYVAEYLVPLPPFGEQQRICDRVVQVLDMLSSIEASLS